MSVTVRLSAGLRPFADGRAELTAEGDTLGAVLDALGAAHPALRARILDARGVRRFVGVYVGDEDARFLEGTATPVRDGDVVTVVLAVSGGAPDAAPLDWGRYGRQIALQELGADGQRRLAEVGVSVGGDALAEALCARCGVRVDDGGAVRVEVPALPDASPAGALLAAAWAAVEAARRALGEAPCELPTALREHL